MDKSVHLRKEIDAAAEKRIADAYRDPDVAVGDIQKRFGIGPDRLRAIARKHGAERDPKLSVRARRARKRT